AVGRALKRVRTAFLDGEVENREEALALAAEVARRDGGRKPRARRAQPGRAPRRVARAAEDDDGSE
ncbi:MAG TPA: hypothetical protein VKB65_04440, partial [Myxococcota bacterium]|nr:hypothetical protein [Myxococcota bacterium]